MQTKTKIIINILICLFLLSCSKVPITNRKQLKMLPESMMMSMAMTNYNDFLSKNPAAPLTDANAKMVKKVGNGISNAVISFLKSVNKSNRIKGYKWDYNLVNNPTVNAWCMPGGKVVVYTGILPYTIDETGLAVVMGHEIAHAVARHGNERLSQQLLVIMGGVSLSVALSEKPEQTQNLFLLSYGVGSILGTLAYSRQHEYEADKLGMVFMALAGYDPSKSVDFWDRMSKISGNKLPEFLSTHPSDEKRVNELKKFLPTAQKYYKAI